MKGSSKPLDGLTPIHLAVIADDLVALKQCLREKDKTTITDDLGFTPLELARLLGRKDCLPFFESAPPLTFQVMLKGSSVLDELKLKDFEAVFKIDYSPFLRFKSYEEIRRVVGLCPYILRSRLLAKENYAHFERYREQISIGALADLSACWIDDRVGYGVIAEKAIEEGAFLGEYTGQVRQLFRKMPDPNGYCLAYPTKWWSLNYFAVDALKVGNLMRFVNHSNHPNISPICAVDRGLLHQLFIAARPIEKGEQLTFDYGADYWIRRGVPNRLN